MQRGGSQLALREDPQGPHRALRMAQEKRQKMEDFADLRRPALGVRAQRPAAAEERAGAAFRGRECRVKRADNRRRLRQSSAARKVSGHRHQEVLSLKRCYCMR